MKPAIFIASSVEGLSIAYAIQNNLNHVAEVTVWPQGVFTPSSFPLENLEEVVSRSDFGIFVFSADDSLIFREEEKKSVRDNVLFELGMFIGKLGRKRTFIVKPDNESIHIASDLIGINMLQFENNRHDKNLNAGTGVACNAIRESIKELGRLNSLKDEPTPMNDLKETVEQQQEKSDWLILFLEEKYEECIEKIKTEIEKGPDKDVVINMRKCSAYSKLKLNFKDGEREFFELINEHKEDDEIKMFLADVYYLEKEYFKAIEFINGNIPENNNMIILKSHCLKAVGQLGEAKKILKNRISQGNNWEIELEYFNLLGEEGSKSEEEIHQIINTLYLKNMNEPKILSKYAYYAFEKFPNSKLSLYLLKKLVDKNPKDSVALGYFGNSLLNLQLYNSAMNAYERANEMEGGNESWLVSNVGNVYYAKGLYNESKKHLKRALEIDKESDYALKRLSSVIEEEKKENEEMKKNIKDGEIELFNKFKTNNPIEVL